VLPWRVRAAAVVLLALAMSGCLTTAPGTSTSATTGPQHPRVVLHTAVGDMVAALSEDKAPQTVANFLRYVGEGFYNENTTTFYRIVPGILAEGGGAAHSGSHPPIADEAKASGLRNLQYTLAMAQQSTPDTATTEFFVNLRDNCTLDPRNDSACAKDPHTTEAGFAVFGHLIAGFDVADHIGALPSPPGVPFSITILPPGAPLPGSPASSSTSAAPRCPDAPIERSPPSSGPLVADLLTPGVWNVCGDQEWMTAWVHNTGSSTVDLAWAVTGAAGTDLPAGWSITLSNETGVLAPNGTKHAQPDGSVAYPDWAWTRIALRIPANQAAATVPLELHAGTAVRSFTVHVAAAPRPGVAAPGGRLQVHEHGTTDGTGMAFSDGVVNATAGQGGATPGFGMGLLGLAAGESVTLVVPPPLGYGYDRPAGSPSSGLSGQTLDYAVTVRSLG